MLAMYLMNPGFAVAASALTTLYVVPDVLAHFLGMGVLVRGNPSGSVYALTFDDGPDPVFTPQVLSILEEHSAKATFFVLGKKVARHPELVSRIASHGHEIGIHGWDHRHPWMYDPLTFSAHLRKTEALLGKKASSPPLFRPPWGFWSVFTLAGTRAFIRVMWSVPGNDWKRGATPEQVAQQVLKRLRPGSIVLLHDGARYSGVTVAALPRIIEGARDMGLTPVTITDLLKISRGAR